MSVSDETLIVFPDSSALCSQGWRPLLMTGMLVQHIRGFFSDPQLITDPIFRRVAEHGVQDYLWRSTDNSGILIESLTRWCMTREEKRPAVLVKRNSWQTDRRGINDMMMGTYAMDAQERYTVFGTGSHTIFCIASESGEAERLAGELYTQCVSFSGLLRADMQLHRFVVAQIDAMTPIQDEATTNYVVPVTVAYAFEESWTNKQHAPRLKTIIISKDLLRS